LSFTDDNLPFDGDPEIQEFELYSESDAPDADEEMSGGPDEDYVEVEAEALEDEDDSDEPGDDEKAELLARVAEYEAQMRRAEYENQQARNKAEWDRIESEARNYFTWAEQQAWAEKDNYVDPDLYLRQELGKIQAQQRNWFQQFYNSQNEARRQQYERAAVPTYAARVATHFDLTAEQAETLLDYDPQHMVREAQKLHRHNAEIARLRGARTQKKRKTGQDTLVKKGAVSGEGRGPVTRIKRGSDDHLAALGVSF
jgi:hypothetical protein